ncbi:MAG: hypothetical protein M1832_006399 [Thelocarpon impressellum]|nr:MAG: hypothetical protein M1832_006399 [Thelocarpon impressellum]
MCVQFHIRYACHHEEDTDLSRCGAAGCKTVERQWAITLARACPRCSAYEDATGCGVGYNRERWPLCA